MTRSKLVTAAIVAALLPAMGCLPRLSPLTGLPVPTDRLPRSGVAPGHHQLVFTWELDDRDVTVRGEGAARIAAPDSARLDFYLAGGFGQGAVILIDDSIATPPLIGGEFARRLIPPAPLLWAVLGRAALPNLPDTVIRVEGAGEAGTTADSHDSASTLRADVGRPVAWRFTFRGDSLKRAERVDRGRVVEWVERSDPSHVRYRNESARRSLQLTVTRTTEVAEFDASIWHFPR
jgi:hypothetical protein